MPKDLGIFHTKSSDILERNASFYINTQKDLDSRCPQRLPCPFATWNLFWKTSMLYLVKCKTNWYTIATKGSIFAGDCIPRDTNIAVQHRCTTLHRLVISVVIYSRDRSSESALKRLTTKLTPADGYQRWHGSFILPSIWAKLS